MTMRLGLLVELKDRISRPLRGIRNRISALGQVRALQRLREGLGGVRAAAAGVLTRLRGMAGVLGLGGLVGGLGLGALVTRFGGAVVRTSANLEDYAAVLETVLGSSKAAKEALDWVREFASSTPYEVEQVIDSFVRLQAYGIDPTKGALKAAGDAAAAMKRPLIDAVEAIADAVTGENERLKSFGIIARLEGDKVRYHYQQNGRDMVREADRNSAAMIEATLRGIFNERFGDAMQRRALTWRGIVNNLKDIWTEFLTFVGKAGIFDKLKGELASLLERVRGLKEDGSLQEWAGKISLHLESLVDWVKDAAPQFGRIVEAIDSMAASLKYFYEAVSPVLNVLQKLFDLSNRWTSGVFNVIGGVRNLVLGGGDAEAAAPSGPTGAAGRRARRRRFVPSGPPMAPEEVPAIARAPQAPANPFRVDTGGELEITVRAQEGFSVDGRGRLNSGEPIRLNQGPILDGAL